MTTSSPWPQEDIEKLTQLWNHSGLSGTQISAEFGGKYSRLAVIGKARRLKLPARIPGTPRSVVKEMKRARAATAPEKGALRLIFGPHRIPLPKDNRPVRESVWEPLPGAKFLTTLQLTNLTCKSEIQDHNPSVFCGLPTFGKSPYCEFHYKKFNIPFEEKKK